MKLAIGCDEAAYALKVETIFELPKHSQEKNIAFCCFLS